MRVQAQHRFSVTDYHRMAETGVLKPDARVELLDGRIIDKSPIGPFHGGMVNRLIRWFTTHARGRWLVSAQNPLRLDDYSEPEPDLLLLKPMPDDYTSRHPRPEEVFLLIEVYREPHFTGYASIHTLRAGDTAVPLAFADAAVDVAELLST